MKVIFHVIGCAEWVTWNILLLRLSFITTKLGWCCKSSRSNAATKRFDLHWKLFWVASWQCSFLFSKGRKSLTLSLTFWCVNKVFSRRATFFISCECWGYGVVCICLILMLSYLLQMLLVCLQTINNFVRFPLSPHEVVINPFLVVAHLPPKPCLKSRSHQNRIITFTYVVLIRRESCSWEGHVIIIASINLNEESSVVSLLQL